MANLRHVTAFRKREVALLARLTPQGSTPREVRAMLKSALGEQYTAWVRLNRAQPVLHKGREDEATDGS